MLLARNVRNGRWTRSVSTGAVGPCADALTRDLETNNDKMSWWIADNPEIIATAIASTREAIANVDLALVDETDLGRLRITWEPTTGKTPYGAANEHHCDLLNLSADSVARLAKHIHSVRNEIARFSRGEMVSLLTKAIERDELRLEQLKARLVCSLAKRVCRPDHAGGSSRDAVLAELSRRLVDGSIDDEIVAEIDSNVAVALEGL